MDKYILNISEAAEVLGVSDETLRNWERDGKLNPSYTEGGHRRYKRIDIEKLAGTYTEANIVKSTNRAALYCRVSSHEQKQKGDLERQVGRMTTEALKRGYSIIAVFDEVGSGMNDNRKKLQKLFELVEKNEVDVILIEHKDRLSRFCINYLISYFKSYNVRVEWADEVLSRGYENELVEDILSLMASFSAKIYGRRSAANRKKKVKEPIEV
jgi:excisionase family DNA binding protein